MRKEVTMLKYGVAGLDIRVVSDTLGDVMFKAEYSTDYVSYVMQHAKPWLRSIKQVPEGTGNKGDKLQYECKYEGFCMTWSQWSEMMSQINL